MRRFLRSVSACSFALLPMVVVVGLLPNTVAAQRSPVKFPTDPASWLNSPPLSVESLQGKAAFLWFFEEGCPRCREKWPGLLATAGKFRDQPIVFIAVNSGSARGTVAAYARQNGVGWPIIVDTSRQFEKQAGVGEISLQNIHQACMLMPDGTLRRADWSDVSGSAEQALKTAKWNVDPKGIPASLRSAWLGVEFGEYASVANVVKRSAASRKPDEKAAGDRLLAYVRQKLDGEAAGAKQVLDSGQNWPAYKAYEALLNRFRGYDLPDDAAAKLRKLGDDPQVKEQLIARKMFEGAMKYASNPRTRNSAVNRLKTLVQQHPDTEAAVEAQKLLQQAPRSRRPAAPSQRSNPQSKRRPRTPPCFWPNPQNALQKHGL